MPAVNISELGGWPGVLRRLTAGEDLSADEAAAVLGDILEGTATSAQIAGFAIALRMKGETVEELAGMVEAMLAAAEPVVLPSGIDPVDTCGTGGSPSRRLAAFNVSTIASFVIAGAGGVVCKHGGRAATATSSSADLLEALGVAVELGPEGVARCLLEAGMAFCFAPRFHPAMRHAGPTRRELGVPTVFNFLGPLANPARVRRQVLGVSDPAMSEKMAGVLLARGDERALVVHGHDGLDELTTLTTSDVIELRDGELRRYTVDPADLGLQHEDPSAVRGGDTATNVDLARRILDGERIGQRDLVLLNAAAGLVAAGVVDELADGVDAGRASIDGGRAAAVLDDLVRVSKAAESDSLRS
jgi:anthranilate phosphoribosyltransferase